MDYFTALFFVVAFVLLAFMAFQAINFWRSRPRAARLPPRGGDQPKSLN